VKSKGSFLFVVALAICAPCSLFGSTSYAAIQTGTAVYYSDSMDGKRLSRKGETYDKHALTAATHKRYRLGGMLRVTNISNKKSVTVRVNDRMNPRSKAVIDLFQEAC
jgi:rare lipoprotein A